jgi:hypothetical protein
MFSDSALNGWFSISALHSLENIFNSKGFKDRTPQRKISFVMQMMMMSNSSETVMATYSAIIFLQFLPYFQQSDHFHVSSLLLELQGMMSQTA